MAFLRAKPIGVMGMIDQGEQDDKVHCFDLQLCCPFAAECVLCMHSQHYSAWDYATHASFLHPKIAAWCARKRDMHACLVP